ncbi:hypothetical protein [Paraburkholderia sp.]|uniref:hypothetical protein n=1 Tax=Paraburkholderia sp. TaxID=1926495 RepID=UPI00238406E0|nr:hypothetical protein [Paraburkholderia sp.]MDE1182518.1 hypothetical protein [Paraburkholderia sp.]
MSLYQTSRSIAIGAIVAASALLSACGGGGGGSSGSSAAASSSVLKLSSAVQSEHVARYAAAFGMLSGPGVAAIYTSVSQSIVSQITAGAPSADVACPTSGSVDVIAQNAGLLGMQTGETATVTFNQCVGQVKAPGVSSGSLISGSVTVQVQSVQGVVGKNSADWSYTAVETANALTLTTDTAKTVVNGTVTFTMSYDAATGVTTTTASAPTVTLDRTQTLSTSSTISGNITITSLQYSRTHQNGNPSSDTLSTSGAINIQITDATMAFNVSTPTPVTLSDGDLQAGTIQLTTSDATETITAQDASTVQITVTSNGQSGSYTESVADFKKLASG